jgi:hypothetical protein
MAGGIPAKAERCGCWATNRKRWKNIVIEKISLKLS